MAGSSVLPVSAQSTGASYAYDSLGRLIAVYDSSGNAAVYNYDSVGNLLSIVNYSSSQFAGFNLSSNSGGAGSTFIIDGTDFCSSPTVTINGANAAVVSSTSTQIIVTVPSNATSGPVVVTCGSNQITVANFTVSVGPAISGFSPTIGSAGTAVTINGSNFEAATASDWVRFGITAGPVSSATTSTITAPVPSSASTGYISVTTPTGQSVSSGYFFVPPAPATATSLAITGQIIIGGSPVNVTLSSPGTQALLAFDAVAGHQVSLQITNVNFTGNGGNGWAYYYIIPPGGNTSNAVASLHTGGGNQFINDVNLPTAGTYTVFVVPEASNTGTATFTLTDTSSDVPINGLAIGGSAVTPTTNIAGQDFSGSFSGTAGQQISLQITNPSFTGNGGNGWAYYYIIQPGGNTSNAVASLHTGGGNQFINDITLPTTGSYTLFVDPEEWNTGTATFTLTDTSSNVPISGLTIGGTAVTPPSNIAGQDFLGTFSGTAGQQIALQITNANFSGSGGNGWANYFIIPPGGNTSNAIASLDTPGGNNFINDIVLPTTGTYTLFVDPQGTGTGTATLQLTDTSSNVTISGLTIGGTAVTPPSNIPGQDFLGTFSGTAGQQVTLQITNANFSGSGGNGWANYFIIPPGGNTSNAIASLDTPGGNNFINDIVLPTTGTYTLFVDPQGTGSGSMTLQLWNLSDLSATVNSSDAYAQAVLGDSPQLYWRLDESGPVTAVNAAPAIQYGVIGPTSPDTAITLDGYSSYVSTTKQFSNPSTYSVEAWFKTSSRNGGKLIGLGGSQTGASSQYDRNIYMTNSGQLVFGQYTGSVTTVTSTAAYNDGVWHYTVGTYNGSTIILYVDGSQVGSISAGAPQNYNGYWRLGYDNLNGWPSAPSSYYFQGSLGEAAAYSSALSATQVSNHYAAATGGNYDTTVLADSPTSYWELNESSGPTLADTTGGGNTGTAEAGSDNGVYQGGVTYSQPGAISTDHAVVFDGTSGLVQSGLGPPIGNTNASIEAWVYIPSSWTPGNGSYAAIIQAGTNNGIGFGIGYNYQGTTGFQLFGLYEYVRWVPLSSPPALTTNSWYHLVMTVDGSGVPAFYINGTSYGEASSGGAPKAPMGSMFVADDPAASGRFFGGTVDEVAAYNYALSAAQVSNHYHASGR